MNYNTKEEIIQSIRFFGSVASTPGITEEIKNIANKQIKRLVDVLIPEVDKTVAGALGINPL